ncbi:hypothetical protein [Micromonospora sp. DT229]|uniref:hypothetical protein n=1 Tax=Micromonospora sp. DT229 TaxID=3393430 RepID=UPI003CE731C4
MPIRTPEGVFALVFALSSRQRIAARIIALLQSRGPTLSDFDEFGSWSGLFHKG